MNKCEKRTWWVITIASALVTPFLFSAAFRTVYQYINPIGVEIVSYAQTKQMSSEEKENYVLTLLTWDQKLIHILIYTMVIMTIVALLFGFFFTRSIYLKVGLIILSLTSLWLANYHNYIFQQTKMRLESKKH